MSHPPLICFLFLSRFVSFYIPSFSVCNCCCHTFPKLSFFMSKDYFNISILQDCLFTNTTHQQQTTRWLQSPVVISHYKKHKDQLNHHDHICSCNSSLYLCWAWPHSLCNPGSLRPSSAAVSPSAPPVAAGRCSWPAGGAPADHRPLNTTDTELYTVGSN